MTNSVIRSPNVGMAVILMLVLLLGFERSHAATNGDIITIRNDAPSEYVVVKGDTLWDISGRFLEKPWLWPEIWGLNPQIEDPHWIYPGDVIGLVYVNGRPRLTLNRAGDLRTVVLRPRIRRESDRSAIPAIPLASISSLLSENSLMTQAELDNSPYLLEKRGYGIYASEKEIVFGRGDWPSGISTYEIIRPGREYFDPDTRETVGIEGIYVGKASMLKQEGDQGTLLIKDTTLEVRNGDRLIPSVGSTLDSNFFPEPPQFQVDAQVIGIQPGNSIAGNYDSLVLNIGSVDNISAGHLLTVQKQDYHVVDNQTAAFNLDKNRDLIFSGEKFAEILVYRVFEQSSLALVLNTDDVIRINEKVVAPSY